MRTTDTIKVVANAKINLYLDVVGKRQDGYHNLETIFHSIGLHDELILNKQVKKGISVICTHPDVPTDKRNLAYLAAQSLYDEVGGFGGIEIYINKSIPVAAGLAGGSANAAATLVGVNELFDLGIDDEVIRHIGRELGADVPFCLHGGAAFGSGIGDILEPLSPLTDISVVLINSGVQITTKSVFDKLHIPLTRRENNSIIVKSYFETGDLFGIAGNLYNLLEIPVFSNYPKLSELKNEVSKQEGCLGVLMSGSGATLFALMEDKSAAQQCETYFKKRVNYCSITQTSSVGVYIAN
ncbi:4-(cytidine 5'-diphospho)-2-C-methyl-D-erythritol kinase [Candidatus Poribacteria bacterium]|nr:MAG: 4-(cytidine 5'-diphospho)-2-C-methyl-D-erythritol kinase [Candidatus Poribacteria bacterium]